MTPRIVVTGFEPWAHGTENPTLTVVDQLDAANDMPGELTTLRLPVDSRSLGSIIEETLARTRPDIWISLELAPGLAVVGVERVAANVMDFPVPDNVGTQYGNDPVFRGGPDARLATLPVKSIAFALRAAGIPAKVSNTASTYLCNQTMYTALHLIERMELPTRAGFIHVPAPPSLAARQEYPLVEMPSMSIELMTRAVKVAIATTLETATDSGKPGFNY